jgi:hypothetical protein
MFSSKKHKKRFAAENVATAANLSELLSSARQLRSQKLNPLHVELGDKGVPSLVFEFEHDSPTTSSAGYAAET